MKRFVAVIIVAVILLCSVAIPVLAAVPTVTNRNADIDGTSVTLWGNITATGVVGDDDYRGFVWDDMSSHANPMDTTPALSGYNNYWTESGSFGIGEFSYEATGLTALVTYYYRACAHSTDGWAYSDEITFFALVDGKVYLKFRPDLSESRITGNAANPSKPADILVEGMFLGYIFPIYNDDDQELFFMHCVPNRWDDSKDPVYASHILVHVTSSLSNANEANRGYRLQLAWDEVTPNEEEIPAPVPLLRPNIAEVTRMVYSNTQYECYRDWFVILCNVDDGIEIDDLLALRLRRTLYTKGESPEDELVGDLIIHAVDMLYARGDLLGDPGEILLEDDMILLALIFMALGLLALAYSFRKQALAFGAVGAWMLLAAYTYEKSTALGDFYYIAFWVSIGLMIVTALLAMALRDKVETTEGKAETAEDRMIKRQEEYAEKRERHNRAYGLETENAKRKRRESNKSTRLDK